MSKSNFPKININDANYPSLLKETSSPPEKIFTRGNIDFLNAPCIAIVGTRKVTEEGRNLARKTAEELAKEGYVIVSGLAMGVDAAAHEGALRAGGKTAAVLGTGINKIYPAQNENLANRIILTGGAIISEYETTPGYKSQFLERNRIVAGLSIATIVIEAPEKSGALVTARLAAECGREVFVFPGPAGHPQWRGSHALIRDGARLVSSIEDILDDLGNITASHNIFLAHPARLAEVPAKRAAPARLSGQGRNGTPRAKEPSTTFANNVNQIPKRIYDALPGVKNNVVSKSGAGYSGDDKTSPEAALIMEAVAKTPLSIDKISEITKLTPQEANQILTDLIIHGIVEETPLGYRPKEQRT